MNGACLQPAMRQVLLDLRQTETPGIVLAGIKAGCGPGCCKLRVAVFDPGNLLAQSNMVSPPSLLSVL